MQQLNNLIKNAGLTGSLKKEHDAGANMINSMFNTQNVGIEGALTQALRDYDTEQKKQEQNFTNEAQAAWIDKQRAMNPFSGNRSQAMRMGLGNTGFNESSQIGVNNAYQKRYTDSKLNFDNILQEINAGMTKARENRDVRRAENERNRMEALLNNFYKFRDENAARSMSSGGGGGGGYYGGSSGYGGDEQLKSQGVHTDYYRGAINPDAAKGTFKTLDKNGNMYQPNNVGGNKLSATNRTIGQILGSVTGSRGANLSNQQIWRTANGQMFVWDGSQNKYLNITNAVKNAQQYGRKVSNMNINQLLRL